MQCRHFTIRLSPQHLIEDEERLNTFLGQVRVHSVQTSLVAPKGERWSVLVFFEDASAPGGRAGGREEAPPAAEGAAAIDLTPEERKVYERLRAWRSERARAEGVPPYVIAHNAALVQIARRHMSLAAAADLAPIGRFGVQRAERYGADILRLLRGGAEGEAALFDDDYAR